MIAGRLNEVVRLFRPTETVNEYGERTTVFTNHYTTRAKVEYSTGNKVIENDEIVFSYAKRFFVRSFVPVVETDQLQWQGKNYRILTLEHRREHNDIVINTELINE